MMCCYLSVYASDSFSWEVFSCRARQGHYVPSLADLERFCRKNHVICPFFLALQVMNQSITSRAEVLGPAVS
ncbi:MAG: hypothetical protein ACOY32_12195 [Thermodesulfobacteriota bacterium]